MVRDPYARWCGRAGAARLPPIPMFARHVCQLEGASPLMVAGSVLVVWLFSSVMLALEEAHSEDEDVDGEREV